MRKEKYEFQWGERCSMLIAQAWVENHGPYLLDRPKHIDYIIISNNRYVETFASETMANEWRSLSKLMFKNSKRTAVMKSSLQTQQKWYKFYKQYEKLNLNKLSNAGLFRLFKTTYNYLGIFANHFSLSQGESSDILVNYIRSELKKEGTKEPMEMLITQTIPDIIFKEQADLALLGKKKKVSNNTLRVHALKYPFLFYNSYNIKENIAYLRKKLNNPFDAGEKLQTMKNLKERQQKIFRKIKNRKVMALCLFLQDLGVDRLELKNCWAGAEFRFLGLFQEIAKRINVPLEAMLASHTVTDYSLALLKGQLLPSWQIKRRIEHFAFWKKGVKVSFVEDEHKIRELLFWTKKSNKQIITTEVIKGMVASPGKVKGRVCVVQSVDIGQVLKDQARFKQGDILITGMTQPNMLPIARKAAAIIADEGGITSHAAVIAREFGIPCIVGAKTATKVFKDGDMVEVDANRGVVRKLDR